ncbi:MAG: Fur family transcriptional regulator [Planctomycetota bacterium]|jgi:Fur family ferric uptake transcriptional regulator
MMRMTNQRRVILEELRKVDTHPTADGVYALVRRRLPRVSLATVYRNLELLSEEDLIQRIETGSGPRRYDGDASHHHHVRCEGCGCVADVPAKSVKASVRIDDKRVCRECGFVVNGHRIDLVGLCARCRRAASKGGRGGRA